VILLLFLIGLEHSAEELTAHLMCWPAPLLTRGGPPPAQRAATAGRL
jgi:hypothetical protein